MHRLPGKSAGDGQGARERLRTGVRPGMPAGFLVQVPGLHVADMHHRLADRRLQMSSAMASRSNRARGRMVEAYGL